MPGTRSRTLGVGTGSRITRRDFVNGVLAGSGALLLSRPGSADEDAYAADAFTGFGGVGDYADANGDTWPVLQAAHRIRDGRVDELPLADEIESVDLVIVGGGPAGLLAAHDFAKRTGGRKRCLVLDNHPVFGGASKQNEFMVDGVRLYAPQAANSFAVPEPGSGTRMDRLFDELGLPREYMFAGMDDPSSGAIRFATDNYANMDGFGESAVDVAYRFSRSDGADEPFVARNIWANGLADAPWPAAVRRDLAGWRNNAGGDEGLSPVELDNLSYHDFLTGVKGYDPVVSRVARPTIGLLTGLPPEAVSAREAARYVNERVTQYPSFPGGNSTLARALVRRLIPEAIAGDDFSSLIHGSIDFSALDRPGRPTRIRSDATVVRVAHPGNDPAGDRVEVTYVKNGTRRRVRAKCVIMASGGWVNRRILKDLPADIRDAYAEFIHAPALIINVALTNWRFMERLGASALRWFDDESYLGFSGNIRAPMLIDGEAPVLRADRPAVLTMYMGLYTPGETDARAQTIAARTRLLGTGFAEIERRLRRQLAEMFGAYGFDPARDIAGIILNRWGHARLARPPGFMLGRHGRPAALETVARGYGRIVIAHSELNGAQNARGAFEHGARAARIAAELVR